MFNQLAALGAKILVIYRSAGSPQHGWGSQELTHPHLILADTPTAAATLVWHGLRNGSLRVVAPFGYRGWLRTALLILARLRPGLGIVTRSDTNLADVRQDSFLKRVARRATIRLVFPRRTRVWSVGDANTAFWRDYVGKHCVTLIPYSTPRLPGGPSEIPQTRQSSARSMRFLFVGRLIALKNVDLLIRAFRELPMDASEGWRLDIVGEGDLRRELENLAGGDTRIRFWGALPYDELGSRYLQSDVLVLPSRREAWGLVINEALGFGLRVIVSDACGSQELVTSADVGEIVPAGDVSALRMALERSCLHLTRRPIEPFDPTQDMLRELRGMGV